MQNVGRNYPEMLQDHSQQMHIHYFLRTCYGALQLSYYYYYYYYYFTFIYFYFILFLFFNLGRYISEDGKINVNSKFFGQ